MSKRDGNKFDRVSRDYYATIDPIAVARLVPHLKRPCYYCEPCAGAGDLIRALSEKGPYGCIGAYDIEPQKPTITQRNCLTLKSSDFDFTGLDYFITNPPFAWDMLKPILDHLPKIKPTWLLLPADRMHNVRMGPYMKICEKVVSVGRMYWQENKVKGVDNFAWFLFNDHTLKTTEFIGR